MDMLPFRGFQLVSDTLDYMGGASARARFSTKTQPLTRAAIIGIGAFSAEADAALFNVIERFSVAGRNYAQGDPFPLGLLASGAVPNQLGGTRLEFLRSLFPGQILPLMDGTFCSGIMINGREEVDIDLTDVKGDRPISNIVLYCLEFPRGAYPAGIQARIDQLWDRFRAGIGQAHFVGNKYALAAGGPPLQVTLEALVNPPHTMNARREEVRGLEYATAATIAGFNTHEPAFVRASAQIRGQTLTETSNAGIPARNIFGHANLHHLDQVRGDFERDSRSLILWQHPMPGVVFGDIDGRLVTLFEGTDRAGPKLCGPSVF